MAEDFSELVILLALEDGDTPELDEMSRQLRAEIEELNIESIENVSQGSAPAGTKAADWASIGQLAVTLAPSVIPPLFDLLKSWTERRPGMPVKVKVRVGKNKTAQIEYDPTTTSAGDLEALIRTLARSMNK